MADDLNSDMANGSVPNRSSSMLERLERNIQDQEKTVNKLETGYSVITTNISTLTNAVDRLTVRLEENSKTNWPLMTLVATLIPVAIAGLGFYMTSYTSSSVAPIHSEITQIETNMKNITDMVKEVASVQTSRGKDLSLLGQTAITNQELVRRHDDEIKMLQGKISESSAADVNSRTDRMQLNERLRRLEEEFNREVADRRASAAETRVQLAEVEQQFHSVSNLENLRAAQQERLNSIMWEKTHPGERYPNGTFFPTSIFQGQGGSGPINPQSSAP
jgi:chromosome segregation ATPase